MDILVHFRLALFLEVALAGSKPHEHGFGVGLYVLVHKVGENYRLSATRRTFEHDVTDGLVHGFKKRLDRLQLKFF